MKGRLLLITLVLLAACGGKNGTPAGVLPREKMQMVLWDMMRADQFLTDFVLNKDSTLDKKKESLKYYRQIFSIHQITREQFEKSFSFYERHPGLFKNIMDSLSQSSWQAPTQIIREDK